MAPVRRAGHQNPRAKCPCRLHGIKINARSVHASCMEKFPVREVSVQRAWGNFSCAKCPCSLHGEISRARSVHAACMGKFLVREVSVQRAWRNFSCAKCPCSVHGEISRARSLHAACESPRQPKPPQKAPKGRHCIAQGATLGLRLRANNKTSEPCKGDINNTHIIPPLCDFKVSCAGCSAATEGPTLIIH